MVKSVNYKKKYLKYKKKLKKLQQKGGIFVTISQEMLDNNYVQDFKSCNHCKSCSHCVAGFLGLDQNTQFWAELYKLLEKTPDEGILDYDFKNLINSYEDDIIENDPERINAISYHNKHTEMLNICNPLDFSDIEYNDDKCGEIDYDRIYETLEYYIPNGYCTILSYLKHDRIIGHYVIICNINNILSIIDIHKNLAVDQYVEFLDNPDLTVLYHGYNEVTKFLENSKSITIYINGLYLNPIPLEYLNSEERKELSYYGNDLYLSLDSILP